MMQIDDDRNPWLEAISAYKKIEANKQLLEQDLMQVDEENNLEKHTEILSAKPQIPVQFQYFINNNPVQSQPGRYIQREVFEESEDVEMEPSNQAKPSASISISKLLGVIVVICIALIAISFITHFYSDVFYKIQSKSSKVNMKIAACAKSYLLNSCSSITSTVPHMASICHEWQECMQQDPDHVDRLEVFGEVFSNLLNAFIDPLSWKVVSVATVWILSTIYIIFQLSIGKTF